MLLMGDWLRRFLRNYFAYGSSLQGFVYVRTNALGGMKKQVLKTKRKNLKQLQIKQDKYANILFLDANPYTKYNHIHRIGIYQPDECGCYAFLISRVFTFLYHHLQNSV
jgi:hypothetical protein